MVVGNGSSFLVSRSGVPLFSNTEIVEDLIEEIVDEGFAEDAAEVFEGDVEVDGYEIFGPVFLQGLRNAGKGLLNLRLQKFASTRVCNFQKYKGFHFYSAISPRVVLFPIVKQFIRI